MKPHIPSLKHPMAKARGLGSAKDGLHHWIAQRLTAIALAPLSLWLLYSFLYNVIHMDARGVKLWLSDPVPATLLVLTIIALFYHAKLGLQVIIEDYVSCPCGKIFLLLANKFFCYAAAILSILAVVKMHVGL